MAKNNLVIGLIIGFVVLVLLGLLGFGIYELTKPKGTGGSGNGGNGNSPNYGPGPNGSPAPGPPGSNEVTLQDRNGCPIFFKMANKDFGDGYTMSNMPIDAANANDCALKCNANQCDFFTYDNGKCTLMKGLYNNQYQAVLPIPEDQVKSGCPNMAYLNSTEFTSGAHEMQTWNSTNDPDRSSQTCGNELCRGQNPASSGNTFNAPCELAQYNVCNRDCISESLNTGTTDYWFRT